MTPEARAKLVADLNGIAKDRYGNHRSHLTILDADKATRGAAALTADGETLLAQANTIARLTSERDAARETLRMFKSWDFPGDLQDLAVRCDAAEARVKVLEEALGWYAEQSRLCRLIHAEGDVGRSALANDGGAKARAALKGAKP